MILKEITVEWISSLNFRTFIASAIHYPSKERKKKNNLTMFRKTKITFNIHYKKRIKIKIIKKI